ncbi:MAG TPA: PEP-utilizing enzyme [Vicinamibacteria bacterium]
MTDAFTPEWDDASLADLHWEWNEQVCPRPLRPLAGDFLRSTSDSVNCFYERAGVPFRMECRIVHGYAYTAQRLLVAESELPDVLARMKELVRSPEPSGEAAPGPPEERPLDPRQASSFAELWDRSWRQVRRGANESAANLGFKGPLEDLVAMYKTLWPQASAAEAMTLVQGRPSRLHDVQRDLHRLAQRARAAPPVAALIVCDPESALAELEQVEGGPQFLEALREFLGAHGHLGAAFCDLAEPTWVEDPARVLHEIQGRVLDDGDDPELRRRRLESEAEEAAGRARAALQQRPEALRRFEELLASAREAAPRLEAQHAALEHGGLRMRRLALEAGRRLVDAGALDEAADVFHLHTDEVGRALRDLRDLRALVASRRTDHGRWAALRPPRYIGRDAAALAAGDDRAGSSPSGVLRGMGAGGGRARGPARIVVSEADFPRVQRGDILVCPTTSPSWVPLFDGVAGLVTNTGGLLSHGAILAREFGVAAVVGAREATQRLRDGQWVEVDGAAGFVRVL